MKVKSLIAASAIALSSFGAFAAVDTTFTSYAADPIIGSSFSDVSVATFDLTGLSDLTGSVFAAESLSFFPSDSLRLQKVSFSSTGLATYTDLDPSANGFSFHNIAAGTYQILASGTLSGSGYPGLAVIGTHYTVTAVPEPESFAMMLAGLGLIGSLSLRRKQKAA